MPGGERTEPASPRKREQARRKGQVAQSTDLANAVSLLGALAGIKALGGPLVSGLLNIFRNGVLRAASFDGSAQAASRLLDRASLEGFMVAAPIIGVVMLVGVVVNVAQVGLILAPAHLSPNLSRLNPAAGLARIFSGRGGVELLKSALKVAVLTWLGYTGARDAMDELVMAPAMDIGAAMAAVGAAAYSTGLKMGLFLLVLGVADYIYQRREFEKSIMMTREEVKEELKQSEGDPMMKSRIRARMRAIAMRRMMADVPKATVVVTNPTHYAVALRYEEGMSAPKVVAKGQNLIAQRIRELALEHGVPIVENPPLAQSLYKACEVGQEIPESLYRAVAEVLAYVYMLNRRQGAGRR